MLRFLIKRMCDITYYYSQTINSKSYTLSKRCTNGVRTLRDFTYQDDPNTIQRCAFGNITLYSGTIRLLSNLKDYADVYNPIRNTPLSKIMEEICDDRHRAFKELNMEKLL